MARTPRYKLVDFRINRRHNIGGSSYGVEKRCVNVGDTFEWRFFIAECRIDSYAESPVMYTHYDDCAKAMKMIDRERAIIDSPNCVNKFVAKPW